MNQASQSELVQCPNCKRAIYSTCDICPYCRYGWWEKAKWSVIVSVTVLLVSLLSIFGSYLDYLKRKG